MTQFRDPSSRFYGGGPSPAPDGLDRTLVDLEPLVDLDSDKARRAHRPDEDFRMKGTRWPYRKSWSSTTGRMIVLSVWSAIWFLIFAGGGAYSWHYFTQGSSLVFGGAAAGRPAGGLHVYANYPQLQFGPVTFAAADLLRLSGSVLLAEVVMTAMGLLIVYCIERIAVRARPNLAGDTRLHATLLIGGGTFLVGWADLSVAYGHLDDVIALLAMTSALWALVCERPMIAGICVGLAVDAKPWALVFLPLILAVPAARRRSTASATSATVVLAWLPFMVADPHTLTAAGYTIVNEPSSALRALGVDALRTPGWDRPAQIVLGCLLGTLAVKRGRWPAIIALGVAARLILDPGVYGYYTAGILLGTLIWDILGSRRPIPVWTPIVGITLAAIPVIMSDTAFQGRIRLWLLLAVSAALLLGPAHRSPEAARRR